MRKSTKIISIFSVICLLWLLSEIWPKKQVQTTIISESPAPEIATTTEFKSTPINSKGITATNNVTEKTNTTVTTTLAPIESSEKFATIIVNQKQYPIYSTTSTLYQILQSLSQNNEIEITTKYFPGMGEFVETINGITNDKIAGKYWIYYINGAVAQIGISQYIPKQNDIIEWKYEMQKF